MNTFISTFVQAPPRGAPPSPVPETTARRKTTRPRGYITDYRPHGATRRLIEQVQAILDEYADYLPLTVRQIFYRLVALYAYEKTEAAYDRLGNHLVNARRARIISFDDIRDDGIFVARPEHFESEDAFWRFVRGEAQHYTRHKLARQPFHIEIWCEASGMIPQVARVAENYSISVFSSSGFDSLTAKRAIVSRICHVGKPSRILHLGDFDPSGVSIFDAVSEDVHAFLERDRPWGGVDATFHRIALTAEQVRTYDLPTAPAKASDSRSRRWAGETCQLEALSPDVLAALIEVAIGEFIDAEILTADIEAEQLERGRIAYSLPAGGAA